MNGIDTRFYPATDRVDWKPLVASGRDPGNWMFMGVTADGQRIYKHSLTRESLFLKVVAEK